MFVIMEK